MSRIIRRLADTPADATDIEIEVTSITTRGDEPTVLILNRPAGRFALRVEMKDG